MEYINAAALLPEGLLREVQRYIQAGYLYVPAPENTHRAWGEVSGSREALDRRNAAIQAQRQQGETLEALARQYHLSVSAIRKIIYR